ncbi:MAG: sulfatase-like hydrolase/transferase, partial [Verrucomicrobiota bacterium]
MRGIILVLVLHACTVACFSVEARKPNIVLIMADDIGIEGFGCYGGTSYQTPHIDHLAKTGLRFTHAYSQPLCTPTRVQFMTGKYNQRNW